MKIAVGLIVIFVFACLVAAKNGKTGILFDHTKTPQDGASKPQILPGCSAFSCEQMQNITDYWFPSQYADDFVCIGYYESSWCPGAWNGGCCYGLFQINQNHIGESGCPAQSVDDLYDPDINAQCAVAVLNSQGLNAWQTWSDGDCNNWNMCSSKKGIKHRNKKSGLQV